MSLDGFSFTALTGELNRWLGGSRLEQAAVRDYCYVLNLRAPGKSLALAFSIDTPPHGMFIAHRLTGAVSRNAFTHVLENHLSGLFCTGLSSPAFERWATMGFAAEPGQQPRYLLHIELMGRNNHLTLCDQNIVLTTTRRGNVNQSGDRFRQPPPVDKLPPLGINPGLVHQLIVNQGQKTVARALVGLIHGIGPLLAEELVHRCQVPSELPADQLTEQQAQSITEQIRAFAEKAIDGQPEPWLYPGPTQPKQWYWQPLHHLFLDGKQTDTISQALATYCQQKHSARNMDKLRNELSTAVESASGRLKRTLGKQRAEMERARDFQRYKEQADTILANMHELHKGQGKAVLTNPHTGQPIELNLDPGLSPSANAQLLYRKSSRLKKADNKIARQMKRVGQNLDYLSSLAYSIEQAETQSELEEIRQEMMEQGLVKRQGLPGKKAVKPPFLKFNAPGGEMVMLGKNNRQNEQLTLRQADKEHVWLHARDYPGSHAVLCTTNPSPEALHYAASVAAWHSKARNSPKVEVVWTKVKHVKKIPGTPPGRVQYTNYQSIVVDPLFHRQSDDADTQ